MVVLNQKAFKLPFMQREKFVLLLRLGLGYDKTKGMYYVNSYNNIEKLTDAVAEILGVEEVTFTQTCAVCRKDFPCSECKYLDSCATKNLPFRCVCTACLSSGRAVEETA